MTSYFNKEANGIILHITDFMNRAYIKFSYFLDEKKSKSFECFNFFSCIVIFQFN